MYDMASTITTDGLAWLSILLGRTINQMIKIDAIVPWSHLSRSLIIQPWQVVGWATIEAAVWAIHDQYLVIRRPLAVWLMYHPLFFCRSAGWEISSTRNNVVVMPTTSPSLFFNAPKQGLCPYSLYHLTHTPFRQCHLGISTGTWPSVSDEHSSRHVTWKLHLPPGYDMIIMYHQLFSLLPCVLDVMRRKHSFLPGFTCS